MENFLCCVANFSPLCYTGENSRQRAAREAETMDVLIVVDMQNDFVTGALGSPEAEIVVEADCCAGVTPESHRTALEAMKACQIAVKHE